MTLLQRRVVAAPLAAGLLVLALAGCSSSSGGSGDSGSAASAPGDFAAPGDRPALGDAVSGVEAASSRSAADRASGSGGGTTSTSVVQQASVIRTGTVALRADDVAKAAFEVQRITDTAGGEVSQEKTTTDDDGKASTSRQVLRIPTDSFTDTFDSLKQVAELETAASNEEDVTTQVVDNEVRVRVARASIDRIQTLLGRAQKIRDVIAIESQLSRRQAALSSLLRQQAYLADQTSMSTITVNTERAEKSRVAPADEANASFLSGLGAGWHGLVSVAVGLSVALGAVLPWLVVALVLGLILTPVVRRVRRRRTTPDPTVTA